jgi:aspartate oxidase
LHIREPRNYTKKTAEERQSALISKTPRGEIVVVVWEKKTTIVQGGLKNFQRRRITNEDPNILIVGGGLSGLILAYLLKKKR